LAPPIPKSWLRIYKLDHILAWSTGLFDCCDDVGGSLRFDLALTARPYLIHACPAVRGAGCLTIFCPCVTFGRIARIVSQGGTYVEVSLIMQAATPVSYYYSVCLIMCFVNLMGCWSSGMNFSLLRERDAVRAAAVADGDGLLLLLLLPRQAAVAVRPHGGALRRLLHPLVLRAMRALPGVSRDQKPRIRRLHRYVLVII
ncbi:hypothetical protein EJB05_37615, partial [Eragrostis curvula]